MTGFKHDPLAKVGIHTPLLKDTTTSGRAAPVTKKQVIVEKRVQIRDGVSFFPAEMPWWSDLPFKCCTISPYYRIYEQITSGTHGVVYKALGMNRGEYVLKLVRADELNAIQSYGTLEDTLTIYPEQAAKLSGRLKDQLKLTEATFQSPGERYRVIMTVIRRSTTEAIPALCDSTEFKNDKVKQSKLIALAARIAKTEAQKRMVREVKSASQRTWPITFAVMPFLGESLDSMLKNHYTRTCFEFAGTHNPITNLRWENASQQKRYGILKIAEAVTLGLMKLRDKVLSVNDHQHFTHGDMKPHNCLVKNGEIIVVDYDSIRSWNESPHRRNHFHYGYSPVGTPGFLAPELREGRRFIVRLNEDGKEEYLFTPYDYMPLDEVLSNDANYRRVSDRDVKHIYFSPLKPVSSEYKPTEPMEMSGKFPIQRRNVRTDIYALGCMFYEMAFGDQQARERLTAKFAGSSPWSLSKLAIYHPSKKCSVSGKPLPGTKVDIQFTRADGVRPAIPYFEEIGMPERFWDKLLPGMLAADPDSRFGSFEKVLHEVRRCLKLIAIEGSPRIVTSVKKSSPPLAPLSISAACPIPIRSTARPPLPVAVLPPYPASSRVSDIDHSAGTMSGASSATVWTGPSTPPSNLRDIEVVPTSI